MTIETMAMKEPETTPASAVVDQKVVAELVARASAEGVSLTGEGGLLQQRTGPQRGGVEQGAEFRIWLQLRFGAPPPPSSHQ